MEIILGDWEGFLNNLLTETYIRLSGWHFSTSKTMWSSMTVTWRLFSHCWWDCSLEIYEQEVRYGYLERIWEIPQRIYSAEKQTQKENLSLPWGYLNVQEELVTSVIKIGRKIQWSTLVNAIV